MAIYKNALENESLEDVGTSVMESYISYLSTKPGKKQLHYWYVDVREEHGKTCTRGHGIVTGHERLMDSQIIHTSSVQSIVLDNIGREMLLTTNNSVYHCPLEYCDFEKQDKYPDIIPDYKHIKDLYKDRINYPFIEPGKVLLVLANFCEYYFHSLYYVPKGSETGEKVTYYAGPHIGTFQDSFLIQANTCGVDLRYFPHYQNIEFYAEYTEDCPLYIENIGDCVLYARTSAGTIKLNPGDRKKVSKKNAESERPILPGGDLYPAGFVDLGTGLDLDGNVAMNPEEREKLKKLLTGSDDGSENPSE